MLTLVTSNPAKYAPFAPELERWRITLEAPGEPLPEVQSLHFAETLAAKARAAAQRFGRPVLVDDAGLVLAAYAPFPGPLTATVLRSLGAAGLGRLLHGAPDRATLECHLGAWVNGRLRHWTGRVAGRLDPTRPPRDPRMPLTDWFIPDADAAEPPSPLLHRARALAALERDVWSLHLETAPPAPDAAECPARTNFDCPFCREFQADDQSIFATMMEGRLASRILYEDEHFIVLPPLGAFIPGGLLVLTREHILSLAHLPPELFAPLEKLLQTIRRAVVELWGVPPLVFEHGPAPEWSKGVCCVDHAHLNLFPAPVTVHPHLAGRMSLPLTDLVELRQLRSAEFGYLMVQENDGSRRVFDGRDVPTQLVRRIITRELGLADRWHWRDYPGREELLATYRALQGRLQP